MSLCLGLADTDKSRIQSGASAIMLHAILRHYGAVEDTVSMCETGQCCHPAARGDAIPQHSKIIRYDRSGQSTLEGLEVLLEPICDMPRRISELPAADFGAYPMIYVVWGSFAPNGLPGSFVESTCMLSLCVDLDAHES